MHFHRPPLPDRDLDLNAICSGTRSVEGRRKHYSRGREIGDRNWVFVDSPKETTVGSDRGLQTLPLSDHAEIPVLKPIECRWEALASDSRSA